MLFLGHFWTYGIFFLTFLLFFICEVLCHNVESLKEYTWISSIVLGIGVCSAGINLIIAAIFRKPHILLIEQFTTHQKMNPDEITWNEFDGKPYIGAGILLCVLGLFSFVAAIIIAI